ncbi:MAG: group II intron reverse transcriptase/maturase [Anaerolineales bacterium]
MITEKQAKLAKRAVEYPEYRFKNLYQQMHWRVWIEHAANQVLARSGSSTAGVDGKTRNDFKEDYERHIAKLINQLKSRTYKPQPVRRTYIPKGNGKKRPLGIPILYDRIVQEALRMMLDPIFESDFQHHSYGFRKGRCTMDAIAVLMPLFNTSAKHYYVIEGDIRSYFDNVHHEKLMTLIRKRVADKAVLTLIWQFLKAGVMEGELFAKTETGVPQGGAISPLLANIYLNEFDKLAERKWHSRTRYERQHHIRKQGKGNYCMVRYADDFVIVGNGPINEVRQIKEEVKNYLADELYLELSEEKTKITHVNDGFTFLGFHIQRVRPEGKWVVHLRPSEKTTKRVKRKIKELTGRNWTWMDEYIRLTTLNAIVRGWCEYYKHTSLHKDLEEISRYMWHRYLGFLLKKHKNSRKRQLIQEKTVTHLNRTRWKAEIQEQGETLIAYQWLPTPKELPRSRYRMKGRGGFPHPYLEPELAGLDNPEWEGTPNEKIFVETIGVSSRNRDEPIEFAETKLRVKMRDGWKCTKCGSPDDLRVHHKKGMKSHAMKNLITLCLECHKEVHGYRKTT